jgi:hypothetical protein
MKKVNLDYQTKYLFNKSLTPKKIRKTLKQTMCKRYVPTKKVITYKIIIKKIHNI